MSGSFDTQRAWVLRGCDTHWDIKLGTVQFLIWGNQKHVENLFLRALPFHPLTLQSEKCQRICLLPTWKWLWLPGNILSYQSNSRHALNDPRPPARQKVKYNLQFREANTKSFGKGWFHTCVTLSYTVCSNPTHPLFFLFRQKRANCPGSDLNTSLTKQRYETPSFVRNH